MGRLDRAQAGVLGGAARTEASAFGRVALRGEPVAFVLLRGGRALLELREPAGGRLDLVAGEAALLRDTRALHSAAARPRPAAHERDGDAGADALDEDAVEVVPRAPGVAVRRAVDRVEEVDASSASVGVDAPLRARWRPVACPVPDARPRGHGQQRDGGLGHER